MIAVWSNPITLIPNFGRTKTTTPARSNPNKKIGRKPINVSDPLVGDKIIEARSFLQLPLNTDFAGTGVDTPHLDRFEPHLVYLYYVCDSDGDTIIYDYKTEKEGDVPFFEDVKELKRITPKQGRVVIFDGMYWHTAEQPKKDVRCILNFNISSNGTWLCEHIDI